jgi:hypothetical protein
MSTSSARFDGCDTIIFPFAPVDTAPERILSQVESLHHRRRSSLMAVHAGGLFPVRVSCLRATVPSLGIASTSSGRSRRSDRLTFPAFGFPAASLGLVWGLAPAPSHLRRLAGPHHGRNVAINDVVLLIGGACVLVMWGRRTGGPLIATFGLPFGTRGAELADKFSERFTYDGCGALPGGLGTLAGGWGRDIGCEPCPLVQLLVRRRGDSYLWGLVRRRRWGRGRRRRGSACVLHRGWLRPFVVFVPVVRTAPLVPLVLLLEYSTFGFRWLLFCAALTKLT